MTFDISAHATEALPYRKPRLLTLPRAVLQAARLADQFIRDRLHAALGVTLDLTLDDYMDQAPVDDDQEVYFFDQPEYLRLVGEAWRAATRQG
jgi:hypothetical protein